MRFGAVLGLKQLKKGGCKMQLPFFYANIGFFHNNPQVFNAPL